ncbi:hypothetical protein ACH665_00595, partial [Klebsiella pneumoniae]
GTVCVVGKIRDLILQLSKSSIYSTKPFLFCAAYKKKKKNNKQIIKSSTLNPALNPPPREIKSIFGIKNIT